MKRAVLARFVPVAVILGVLALVVASGVDLSESARHISSANPWWLLCSLAAITLMRLLRAWRWGGLFPLVGLAQPPYWKQVHIILAADLVNTFVPRAATMAGKGLVASRVYAVGLGAIAATLVLELAIDTAVLFVLAAGLIPYLLYQHGAFAATLLVVPVLGLAAVGRLPVPAAPARRLLRGLPVPRRVGALAASVEVRPRGSVRALLTRAVVGTFAIHACRIGVFVAVAYSIGGLPLLPVIAATVLSTPAQLFPFTIGGAGVREGLLILVLANFGVAAELGLALGVTVLLVSSASALLGAAVVPSLLLARRRGPAGAEVAERGSAT